MAGRTTPVGSKWDTPARRAFNVVSAWWREHEAVISKREAHQWATNKRRDCRPGRSPTGGSAPAGASTRHRTECFGRRPIRRNLARWLPEQIDGDLSVGSRSSLVWPDQRVWWEVVEARPPSMFVFRRPWLPDERLVTRVDVNIAPVGYGSRVQLADGPFPLHQAGVIDAWGWPSSTGARLVRCSALTSTSVSTCAGADSRGASGQRRPTGEAQQLQPPEIPPLLARSLRLAGPAEDPRARSARGRSSRRSCSWVSWAGRSRIIGNSAQARAR
jgi:hypothetical protein